MKINVSKTEPVETTYILTLEMTEYEARQLAKDLRPASYNSSQAIAIRNQIYFMGVKEE